MIDGEELAPGTSAFLPSIAVNDRGDVAIVYHGAGPNLFPGVYVAASTSNEIISLGKQSTPIQVGSASFVYPVGHWGDSSTIVVDPNDGTTFWANGSYIVNSTTWGTVAASVVVGADVAPTAIAPLPIATASGNPLIDAMMVTREVLSVPQTERATTIGHTAYDWGGKVGEPVTLTYSFAGPGATFAANYPTQYSGDVRVLPDVVRSAFEDALQAWSSVANVTFQRVQETGGAFGDIRVGVSASNTNFGPGQAGAEATPPTSSNTALAGDVWLSPTAVAAGSWDWSTSGAGYMTALHELGHAVFNLTDTSTDRGIDGVILPAADNFRGETVMSYSVVPGATTGDGSINQGSLSYWPTTPMVLDILAAQWLYGANNSYHAGNDTYTFGQSSTYYMTIWDGGGNDTISIAGNTKAGVIDLRPGQYSDVGSVVTAGIAAGPTSITKTIGIAYGAIIENAIGGSKGDAIVGNDADNILQGDSGDDTIDAGFGMDVAVFNGLAANFSILAIAGGYQVKDNVGTDGTDLLSNVEFLRFSDQTIQIGASASVVAASASKAEGQSGTTAFTFTVTRSGDTSVSHSASYAVSGAGAKPANASDVSGGVLPTGTVTFAAGETSKTIIVTIQGDTVAEADEGFAVTLSSPSSGLTIATPTAVGTIQNDDGLAISIAASSASRPEGNAGTTAYTFTVTLDQAPTSSQSVNWSVTGSGTNQAVASDFSGSVLPFGTLAFAAGETSKTITVNVQGDTTVEPTEGFTVALTNPSAGLLLGTSTATGSIQNDDISTDTSTTSIVALSASMAEGNTGTTAYTFTVTLDRVPTSSQTVSWAVAGSGTKQAIASDFAGSVLPSGTTTFAAGEISKIITVNVQGDTTVEPTEGFTVTLANPTAGLLVGTSTATGTIQNDDNPNISGTAHDDIFGGSDGKDVIDGGLGTDAVSYAHSSTRYKVSVDTTSLTVEDKVGTEGVDTLINIEIVSFSGSSIQIDWFTKTASLLTSQRTDLTDLYIAYFNRAPDAIGLNYWGSRFKDGMALSDIAKSFFDQSETKLTYPPGQSTTEFVTKVYNNVLGRAPDQGGLDYWAGDLNAGRVTKDAFMLSMIYGARANPNAALDIQYLSNKDAVGKDFAFAEGLSNATWAAAVMSEVTSAASSVAAAYAKTDAYAAQAAAAGTSELVIQLIGLA